MRLSTHRVAPRLVAVIALSVAATLVWGRPAASQDVEMLGERYGTRPPQAYYDEMARDPLAFQFARGRTARLRARMVAGPDGNLLRVIGPREGPVTGTVRIPVVLGLFSDSPASLSFTKDGIAEAYFGSGAGTVSAYYEEVSGGRVTLEGDLHGWVRSGATTLEVTGGSSGLERGQTGRFIIELLEGLDGIDWGLYDNDGPDGVPNSGDDDGFVDALGVLQPTAGAECGGTDKADRIWSHKWSLYAAAGRVYTTTAAAASGGFIQIDDYFIQGTLSCNERDLAEIGVFTHETGHAFGLPDLYDTYEADGKHSGIGSWGLMGSGSWGCDGDSPESPCHLSAWSKEVLGWANVTVLAPDMDHGTILVPPVETSGTIYRIDAADGSEDYFLLENRQRVGFDRWLRGEGLLIWHIDPVVIRSRWAGNRVNGSDHMGVWLRQADGYDELGQSGGGRGDRDDAYPFSSATRGSNNAFHAGSNPAAFSHAGTATGLTILGIEQQGADISLALLTRFVDVTVRSVGDGGAGGLFTVNGTPIASASHVLRAAPFEEHSIGAAAGEPLGAGRRRGFEAWEDDPSAPRVRTLITPLSDLELVARYSALQVELAIESTGAVNGVAPGAFSSVPSSADLWFDEGTSVLLEAVPQTGFGFLRWTGGLQGQSNPASLTMTDPVTAGADFEFTYEVPTTTIAFPAATAQNIHLEAENSTPPVYWRVEEGALPAGIYLNPQGLITGSALEMGTYPVTLHAGDAIGLTGQGTVTLQVDAPDIGIAELASDFLSVGPSLRAEQRQFLDRHGNASGQYDLGDFRAWVLAHPELPLSAALRAIIGVPESISIPVVPIPRVREGGP